MITLSLILQVGIMAYFSRLPDGLSLLWIAAGMMVGTLFTLFVLPVFYPAFAGSERSAKVHAPSGDASRST